MFVRTAHRRVFVRLAQRRMCEACSTNGGCVRLAQRGMFVSLAQRGSLSGLLNKRRMSVRLPQLGMFSQPAATATNLLNGSCMSNLLSNKNSHGLIQLSRLLPYISMNWVSSPYWRRSTSVDIVDFPLIILTPPSHLYRCLSLACPLFSCLAESSKCLRLDITLPLTGLC